MKDIPVMTPNAETLDDRSAALVRSLTTLLGRELALSAIARDCRDRDPHWFFAWQCSELDEIVDEVCGRACPPDGQTLVTLAKALKEVAPWVSSGPQPDIREMLSDLHARHQMMARELRHLGACTETDQHPDLVDFLFRVMQRHEMMAWMLRVSLDDQDGSGGRSVR